MPIPHNDDVMYKDGDERADENKVADMGLEPLSSESDKIEFSPVVRDNVIDKRVQSAFAIEIRELVLAGYNNNNVSENVLLEVKGFKFAQNKVAK